MTSHFRLVISHSDHIPVPTHARVINERERIVKEVLVGELARAVDDWHQRCRKHLYLGLGGTSNFQEELGKTSNFHQLGGPQTFKRGEDLQICPPLWMNELDL